jgi:deazaflavin-dependent oxidoreductase (nitroreductase family)
VIVATAPTSQQRARGPLEAYRRLAKRFGRTKTAMVLFRRTMPAADRFVSKISGGRHTVGAIVIPTLILSHTGRQSGKHYATPLLYLRWSDRLVVAGSNWGQAQHPAWSTNLLAHPDATVLVDGVGVAVRARLATPDERQELWPLLLETWPAFETYAARASDREIRVFVLDRCQR